MLKLCGLVTALVTLLHLPLWAEGVKTIRCDEGQVPQETMVENNWQALKAAVEFLKSPDNGTFHALLVGGDLFLHKYNGKVAELRGAGVEVKDLQDFLAEKEGALQAGPEQSCSGNLQNLRVAATMWAVDHDGHYPDSLGLLVPEYLSRNFYCPLSTGDAYQYEVATDGKHFTARCLEKHQSGESPSIEDDEELYKQVEATKPD